LIEKRNLIKKTYGVVLIVQFNLQIAKSLITELISIIKTDDLNDIKKKIVEIIELYCKAQSINTKTKSIPKPNPIAPTDATKTEIRKNSCQSTFSVSLIPNSPS